LQRKEGLTPSSIPAVLPFLITGLACFGNLITTSSVYLLIHFP
jgi:hypothetical protein